MVKHRTKRAAAASIVKSHRDNIVLSALSRAFLPVYE